MLHRCFIICAGLLALSFASVSASAAPVDFTDDFSERLRVVFQHPNRAAIKVKQSLLRSTRL